MKQEKSNRGRKGYPLDFKWRVIDDLLATGESIATASQRYGITTRTIRNWLHTFDVELPNVDSRTKCNREEERGEKFERGDVVMFLPGSIVEQSLDFK